MKAIQILLLTWIFSLCQLNLYAQEKTEGLPITVEMITEINAVDGAVLLSGTTYSTDEEPGQIFLEILKPNGGTDNLNGRADKNTGVYQFKYLPKEVGEYKVIAYAADKKKTANTTFTVTAEINVEEGFETFEEAIDQSISSIENTINTSISSDVSETDKAELLEKLKKVKGNVAQFKKAIKTLKEGVKGISKVSKEQNLLKKESAPAIGEMMSEMDKQTKELKKIEQMLGSKQKVEPNICNTAYVIKESCALISTCMNLATKSAIKLIDNFMIDKVWPKAVEKLSTSKKLNDNQKLTITQSGKAFLSAKMELNNLKELSFGVGFFADLTQFYMEYLFKKYCEEYKGPISGDYTLEFKNNGKMYMRYKMTYEGTISVYCKKSDVGKGKSPNLSGYIEGSVTKMDFTDDVWAIEDKTGWKELTYKRFPAIIPNPKIAKELSSYGFGAAANAARPGAFYFPLEAQILNDNIVIKLLPAKIELSEDMCNRTLVAVQQTNNPLSLQWEMFSYPITTAHFILTRSMRMPEKSPTVTLKMKTTGKKTTISQDFTRTETPEDTKVDFNLKINMSNE